MIRNNQEVVDCLKTLWDDEKEENVEDGLSNFDVNRCYLIHYSDIKVMSGEDILMTRYEEIKNIAKRSGLILKILNPKNVDMISVERCSPKQMH